MSSPADLSVTVDAVPSPGLLRPAIEAALAGRPWTEGPEAAVAAAVADAVNAARPTEPQTGGPRC